MTTKECLNQVISKALTLLPPKMTSPEAKAMLLAIGVQESLLTHREQIGGPARGLWQFEMNGGVRGVLRHEATKVYAEGICAHFNLQPTKETVYQNLSKNDVLAAAFARLLLWTIPGSLPKENEAEKGWKQYSTQSWNPGKPHPEKWNKNFELAWNTVKNLQE